MKRNIRAHLANRALQLQTHQLVDLSCKLHGQLIKHLSAEAADDHAYCCLQVHTPLLEVEQLVLPDLAGGRLMLDNSRWLTNLTAEHEHKPWRGQHSGKQ